MKFILWLVQITRADSLLPSFGIRSWLLEFLSGQVWAWDLGKTTRTCLHYSTLDGRL